MATKILKNVTAFTVKRSEWARGYAGVNRLLSNDGKKCCLGFFMLEAGACKLDIFAKLLPTGCAREDVIQNQMVFQSGEGPWDCTVLATQASNINDDRGTSDAEREKRLVDLFGLRGITLTFTD